MPLQVNWSPLHSVHNRYIYTALCCDFCQPQKTHGGRPEWKTFDQVSRLSEKDCLAFSNPKLVDGKQILDILRKQDILALHEILHEKPHEISNEKNDKHGDNQNKWIFGCASVITDDFMSVHLWYPAMCHSCSIALLVQQNLKV